MATPTVAKLKADGVLPVLQLQIIYEWMLFNTRHSREHCIIKNWGLAEYLYTNQ